MGIKPAQEILDAESLTADMLDMASVLLMDAPVNQLHEFGRFAAQLLQIDVKGVVRAVHLAASWIKSFISTLSNSGSSEYLTLKV